MLIEFKVRNFRSIREEQIFSLVASRSDKSLKNCLIDVPLPGMSGKRILKSAAIYGANASGKSNFIQALKFLKHFAVRSHTKSPDAPTGVEPFKLDVESQNSPSSFEVTFLTRGVRYVFGFSANRTRVTNEYLYAYPKGVAQRWYHRQYDEESDTYKWAKPSSAFKHDKVIEELTKYNTLFLSVAPQFNHQQLTGVLRWFRYNLVILDLGRMEQMPLRPSAARVFENNDYKERILNILKDADIGVSDYTIRDVDATSLSLHLSMKIVRDKDGNRTYLPQPLKEISLLHRVSGQVEPVALHFNEEESDGTKRLISMIEPWISMLDHGHTVVVDEIESSLHPLLVNSLLRMLLAEPLQSSKELVPYDHPADLLPIKSGWSQAIFTTHSTLLMNSALMRRDQFWFAEKSMNGNTQLYSLTEYQPRTSEAIGKGYLAGRYGGIPNIPKDKLSGE